MQVFINFICHSKGHLLSLAFAECVCARRQSTIQLWAVVFAALVIRNSRAPFCRRRKLGLITVHEAPAPLARISCHQLNTNTRALIPLLFSSPTACLFFQLSYLPTSDRNPRGADYFPLSRSPRASEQARISSGPGRPRLMCTTRRALLNGTQSALSLFLESLPLSQVRSRIRSFESEPSGTATTIW